MRKPDRSILVTLLAIGQMVVGVLLLGCGVLDFASTAAGSSSATVTISRGPQPITRVYDTREEMEREAPGYKQFLLGNSVASVLLHVAMIAGAVGLLLRHAWGWWVSLGWAVLRLVYQAVTAWYLWSVAMPAANRMVLVVPRDDAGVCSGMVNGNTFYHLFWAFFATGFTAYPIVILILLILPPVRRACGGGSALPREEEVDDRRGRRRREDEWDRPRRRDRDDY
jgi:hypothetical protein